MAGPTRGRVRAAAVVMVVAAAALAGCGGSASPAPTASSEEATTEPTTSATTAGETPAPGPTDWPKPERPEAMSRDDVAGAKAAAQYFIEMYPYVYATGDLEEWKAMSHEECVFCNSVIDNVEVIYGDGGYVTGGDIVIHDVRAMGPTGAQDFHTVSLRMQQAPVKAFSANGEETRSGGGGESWLYFAVERPESEWVIREVQVEEPSEGA